MSIRLLVDGHLNIAEFDGIAILYAAEGDAIFVQRFIDLKANGISGMIILREAEEELTGRDLFEYAVKA
jgi:hypothetical protein